MLALTNIQRQDNDIPGFASLLSKLSRSWCKSYHSYRPHARTYNFIIKLPFKILSGNVYASYVFPAHAHFPTCHSSAWLSLGVHLQV
jgi:hypothetical protein